MKKIFYTSVLFVMVGALSLISMSCSDGKDEFTKATNIDVMTPEYISEHIEAYQLKDVPTAKKSENGKKSVYIDFSNGMVHAYKDNANNSRMIESICHNLYDECDWYKVASNAITPLDKTATEIFNMVTTDTNYATEIMAPIQKTIEKIVEENHEALFVTDFEEYNASKQEEFLGFAKNPFMKWLKMGNSIDFYIMDYQEPVSYEHGKMVDKHLYFIVFSTPQTNSSEKHLKDLIDHSLRGKDVEYKTYALADSFYSMSNEYKSTKHGGIYYLKQPIDGQDDPIFTLNTELFKNVAAKGYEFYPFQTTWAAIDENRTAMMEEGAEPRFTHAFEKLFINLNMNENKDIFTIKELDLKVTDITNDYKLFTQCKEAAAAKVVKTKDESGNVILDVDKSDAVANFCYDSKGNLKNEWKYEFKEDNISEIQEMFVFDQKKFKNDPATKREIKIKFHDNFKAENLAHPGALIRVDVVIKDCGYNFKGLDELFSWESTTKAGKKNESLLESIRNSIMDLNPKGKIVYSYYIRTADEN